MKNTTRTLLTAFVSQIALLSGVADATEKFTVDPSVQQKLIDKQQESSDFLNRINFVVVDEMKGEVLGLSVSGTLASRTDTSGAGRRTTKDPSGLAARQYECKQTNSDTHIGYAKLDMWAKFPDFQTRIQNQIVRMQALDRIRIGWNGTSAAVTTNPGVNTNLQDVNIGWLQKLRTEAPTQVMDEGAVANKVTYGHADADYITIDAAVWDARETLLPTWAKDSTDLVAIVGRDLLHDKYFPLINREDDPTEQIARDTIMATKRLGGLPAYQVPFFPNGKVLITTFDNLSIYQQDGKNRRHIKDVPEADRIEDYQSSNDAYVIEDLDFICMIENLEVYDPE
jgi:P2 family phage major capsid protein